jgi:hypothetical protein
MDLPLVCCSAEINGKRIRDRYVSSVERERERYAMANADRARE